jgi:hypothetical protein
MIPYITQIKRIDVQLKELLNTNWNVMEDK